MTFRRHRIHLWGLCVGLASAGTTAHAAGVQAPLLPSNVAQSGLFPMLKVSASPSGSEAVGVKE